ncbi:ABC transporter permease [Streptomyces sp. NPDC097619]|uniref:ABC transporter permease n=1 Tax=Streptomyces sp. NPDC097619 TaxID=3157228 RepID=UPI0033296EDA
MADAPPRGTAEVAGTSPTERAAAPDTRPDPQDGIHWRARGRATRSARTLRVRTSAAVVAVLVLAVLLVPALATATPDQQSVDLAARLLPPSWQHPFGTDELGRDLLVRCVHGLRVSLLVGVVAALVATLVGTAVGAAAGALGGRADRLLMRLVDGVSSVPHLLLGIFVVAMFRPGIWPVIASVAVTHWLSTARIVRAEVLSLRGRPYIDAAVSGGSSRLRTTVRHLLPGVLPQAGLAAVLMVPHAMWHESALSFLGLGLPAHQASLGTLVQNGRGSLLAGDWWPTLFPGLLLIVPTLALAGLAGAWRDRLDPRTRSELTL